MSIEVVVSQSLQTSVGSKLDWGNDDWIWLGRRQQQYLFRDREVGNWAVRTTYSYSTQFQEGARQFAPAAFRRKFKNSTAAFPNPLHPLPSRPSWPAYSPIAPFLIRSPVNLVYKILAPNKISLQYTLWYRSHTCDWLSTWHFSACRVVSMYLESFRNLVRKDTLFLNRQREDQSYSMRSAR